jgi:beta-carotene 3-hydroxylase
MSTFSIILIVVATVFVMEFVAWASHKYIMHGWGWDWHRDHHEPHNNVLEKTDLFTVGYYYSLPLWWAAVGVTVYGMIYTFIHDGLVHQRFFRWVPKRGYAKRLVQAHKLHHATVGKEGGVSFGFVFARDPIKLKADLKKQREAGIAIVRDAAI